MRNPFDKTDRGLRHYERLRDDLKERSDNVLISLPLFVRIVVTDSASPWYAEFNRFDLLNPCFVHSSFPAFERLSDSVDSALRVRPTQTHVKGIDVHHFLSARLVRLRDQDFSVQDFVSAIAYNRGLHNQPDRPELGLLYSEFVERFSSTAFQLTFDIAACFVESFFEVYEKFCGNNNAFSPENHRQPQLVANGRIIEDGMGRAMVRYSKAYLQLPIRSKPGHGLRVCLAIKLLVGSEGVVFCYGHRSRVGSLITCRLVPGFLLFQVRSPRSGPSITTRVPVHSDYVQRRFLLEAAIYTRGEFVVAIDEWQKASAKLPDRFELEDGKLIIGSDLDGNHSATFYLDALSVESIERWNTTSDLFRSALRKLPAFAPSVIPSNAIHRRTFIT